MDVWLRCKQPSLEKLELKRLLQDEDLLLYQWILVEEHLAKLSILIEQTLAKIYLHVQCHKATMHVNQCPLNNHKELWAEGQCSFNNHKELWAEGQCHELI